MKLTKILKESFNANEVELTDDKELMTFSEWDSMAHMFFITKLEEEYAIELTGDEISEMKTVGNIKVIITSKGKDL
jgi:acyl carrier protein